MVDLVRAVVEGLERLGVEQGYQKIKAGIVIRDNGIQGAFLLAQGVEIHVVVVGDGLDLGQVEGGQPDGGGHEDGLGGLARDKLSRTFSSNSQEIHKKGARSTVWLLTPRLIDYIFPFSSSLQRYA